VGSELHIILTFCVVYFVFRVYQFCQFLKIAILVLPLRFFRIFIPKIHDVVNSKETICRIWLSSLCTLVLLLLNTFELFVFRF